MTDLLNEMQHVDTIVNNCCVLALSRGGFTTVNTIHLRDTLTDPDQHKNGLRTHYQASAMAISVP